MISVKNIFKSYEINLMPLTNAYFLIDCLAVTVITHYSSFIITTIYIPPGIKNIDYVDFIQLLIDSVLNHKTPLLIIGDLNVRNFVLTR